MPRPCVPSRHARDSAAIMLTHASDSVDFLPFATTTLVGVALVVLALRSWGNAEEAVAHRPRRSRGRGPHVVAHRPRGLPSNSPAAVRGPAAHGGRRGVRGRHGASPAPSARGVRAPHHAHLGAEGRRSHGSRGPRHQLGAAAVRGDAGVACRPPLFLFSRTWGTWLQRVFWGLEVGGRAAIGLWGLGYLALSVWFGLSVYWLGRRETPDVDMFLLRAGAVDSLVSPLLPLVLAGAGFAVWATWHLRRVALLQRPSVFECACAAEHRRTVQGPDAGLHGAAWRSAPSRHGVAIWLSPLLVRLRVVGGGRRS